MIIGKRLGRALLWMDAIFSAIMASAIFFYWTDYWELVNAVTVYLGVTSDTFLIFARDSPLTAESVAFWAWLTWLILLALLFLLKLAAIIFPYVLAFSTFLCLHHLRKHTPK